MLRYFTVASGGEAEDDDWCGSLASHIVLTLHHIPFTCGEIRHIEKLHFLNVGVIQ